MKIYQKNGSKKLGCVFDNFWGQVQFGQAIGPPGLKPSAFGKASVTIRRNAPLFILFIYFVHKRILYPFPRNKNQIPQESKPLLYSLFTQVRSPRYVFIQERFIQVYLFFSLHFHRLLPLLPYLSFIDYGDGPSLSRYLSLPCNYQCENVLRHGHNFTL